mmetsp:Transcript_7439/g.17983  ORF Transcript_7439/g.17983 Transcript_7439/m.17983 type:complete len:383 (-) Transcript_7439:832-1980(-)|eukprot:g11400.t1
MRVIRPAQPPGRAERALYGKVMRELIQRRRSGPLGTSSSASSLSNGLSNLSTPGRGDGGSGFHGEDQHGETTTTTSTSAAQENGVRSHFGAPRERASGQVVEPSPSSARVRNVRPAQPPGRAERALWGKVLRELLVQKRREVEAQEQQALGDEVENAIANSDTASQPEPRGAGSSSSLSADDQLAEKFGSCVTLTVYELNGDPHVVTHLRERQTILDLKRSMMRLLARHCTGPAITRGDKVYEDDVPLATVLAEEGLGFGGSDESGSAASAEGRGNGIDRNGLLKQHVQAPLYREGEDRLPGAGYGGSLAGDEGWLSRDDSVDGREENSSENEYLYFVAGRRLHSLFPDCEVYFDVNTLQKQREKIMSGRCRSRGSGERNTV